MGGGVREWIYRVKKRVLFIVIYLESEPQPKDQSGMYLI